MKDVLLTKKKWRVQFCCALVCFLLLCAVQTWTSLDFAFQQLWYNGMTKKWWLTEEEFQATRWLWYDGTKTVIGIFAGICGFVFLFSFFLCRKLKFGENALFFCFSACFLFRFWHGQEKI